MIRVLTGLRRPRKRANRGGHRDIPVAVWLTAVCARAAWYCAFSTSFWLRNLFTRSCGTRRWFETTCAHYLSC